MLRRDFYSTQFSLCVFWRCVGDALHRINQHCYELLLYATIFFFIFRFTPAPGSGETVVFIVLGKISTFRGFYALNDTFYCFSLRTCCTSTNKWKHKVHHLEYHTFESNKSLHWNDLFWFFGGVFRFSLSLPMNRSFGDDSGNSQTGNKLTHTSSHAIKWVPSNEN